MCTGLRCSARIAVSHSLGLLTTPRAASAGRLHGKQAKQRVVRFVRYLSRYKLPLDFDIAVVMLVFCLPCRGAVVDSTP